MTGIASLETFTNSIRRLDRGVLKIRRSEDQSGFGVEGCLQEKTQMTRHIIETLHIFNPT